MIFLEVLDGPAAARILATFSKEHHVRPSKSSARLQMRSYVIIQKICNVPIGLAGTALTPTPLGNRPIAP